MHALITLVWRAFRAWTFIFLEFGSREHNLCSYCQTLLLEHFLNRRARVLPPRPAHILGTSNGKRAEKRMV